MAIIEIRHLSFAYAAYSESQEAALALNDINLEIEKGEVFAILGPTGAGKSTLCLTLNGIIPHLVSGRMAGNVIIAGQDTRDTYPAALSQTIGIIQQDPDSQLFCPSVEEEVAFGLESAGLGIAEINERVQWALHAVRMEAYRRVSPARLSGGQKQRVAIACSLAMLPRVLILDEPASSLDPVGQAEIYETIEQLKREREMTIVLAESDAERIAVYASRMAFLIDGRIIAQDEPGKLLADKELVAYAGIYTPQMMELAWEINARCHTSYHWLDVAQAEHALRDHWRDDSAHD